MKALLSPEGARELRAFLTQDTLIAFDFDGTLAPIVGERAAAVMNESTRILFSRVAARFACAVISGRSRADVLTRIEGAAVRYVLGNHGAEPSNADPTPDAEVRKILSGLKRSGALGRGIEIEDKNHSLSIHYRASPDPAEARESIARLVNSIDSNVRIVDGKMVLNVVPRSSPNKGQALLRLMTEGSYERALFVGDDVTDEDVFALANPTRVFTIRIGETEETAARYYLPRQTDIDDLLDALLGHLDAPRARGVLDRAGDD